MRFFLLYYYFLRNVGIISLDIDDVNTWSNVCYVEKIWIAADDVGFNRFYCFSRYGIKRYSTLP